MLILLLLVSFVSLKRSKVSKFSSICRTIIHTIELLIGRHNIYFRLTSLPASIAVTRLIVSFFGIIISSIYTGKIASTFVIREDLVKTPNDLIKYKYKLNTYSNIHVDRVFKVIVKSCKKQNGTQVSNLLNLFANILF